MAQNGSRAHDGAQLATLRPLVLSVEMSLPKHSLTEGTVERLRGYPFRP
jgi:hypothetical protein